ncbi:MAG: ABC transporter permease [Muribaculaceae bacterium]|nr:ABC transporter permease [Muribaculaceae bacterium]
MFDLISEILQTLRNNKLRTALTGFSVAWGIFMLIVLLGMSRGVFNSFNSHMGGQGANSITVWGNATSKPYHGYEEGRKISLRDRDMDAVYTANSQTVEGVSSVRNAGSAIITTPWDYVASGYTGVDPKLIDRRGFTMHSGRFLNDMDLKNQRKVIVLEKRNADVLFPDSTKIIGGKVVCNGLSFTVIGVFQSDFERTSYIPFTTAMMLTGNDGKIGQLEVDLKNISTIEEGEAVEQDIRNTLAKIHDFDPDDKSALWIWNRFTNHLQMGNGLNILNMAIWIIGLFTMLSGIVGVSNIMFVSVRERTHEIGIRRAIGAKPRNILTQIISESVAITSIFGYIGIFFGILVTELLKVAFANSEGIKDPTVDIAIAIQVTLVLIVAGALAGLFPSLKALKVKPVEALRTE